MIKKILGLMWILITGLAGFSQPEFATIEAKWWYSVNIWGPPVGGIGYTKIEVLGDTIIKGNTCRILGVYCGENSPNDCAYTEFLYDSSEVIFWYMAPIDSFVTLYNFSANPGDTWSMIIATSFGCDDTITIVVDSVDYKIINNQTLKVLYLNTINLNQQNYQLYGQTIKLLGNIRWMFPILSSCMSDESEYSLRCYEDSTLGLYKVDSTLGLSYTWDTIPCDTTYYTKIKEPLNNIPAISVYPTLSNKHLTIQLNYPDLLYHTITYKIYNIWGQMVQNGKINNNKQQINIENLSDNMYLINILFENIQQSFKYCFIKI
ncbi:MAG: T9SS type A sorting domain-containing protein [Bacteroidia bacterium]|nr:T9SS type A sorting domain-containing protein [Bacteroidia bacterium]